MARVSAAEYAEKWGRRLKGATEDIRRGIQRVSEAPGEKAARSQDLMLSKLTASVNDGTWAAQVRAVTLGDWQGAAINKGVPRIAVGVDQAQQSQTQMAERLLAAVDASAAEARRLPKGTLEDSINRMSTFVRGMAARKLRRPGGTGR